MTTMVYKFASEIPPVNPLLLKVETNCREHLIVMGWEKKAFAVNSDWYKGACSITTYKIEELLSTKFRALYQRRKGRNLYDLHKVISTMKVDTQAIVDCFKTYIKFSTGKIPSQKYFIENMDAKMKQQNFIGDITALLRADEKEKYDPPKSIRINKI
jgi:predicted nucleotidyltransferase component of viral defense system